MIKKLGLFVVAICLLVSAVSYAKGKSTKNITGVVNINAASVSELGMLPGVGKAKAEAIISYRQKAPFKSPQELTKVKGIGPKMFAKLQQYVTVDGPTTAKLVKAPSPVVAQ